MMELRMASSRVGVGPRTLSVLCCPVWSDSVHVLTKYKMFTGVNQI